MWNTLRLDHAQVLAFLRPTPSGVVDVLQDPAVPTAAADSDTSPITYINRVDLLSKSTFSFCYRSTLFQQMSKT